MPLPEAGYAEEFCDAFGSEIELGRLQEAISLFELGLVSGNSAVDRHRFLGESLSAAAERGLALFETRGRCVGCHPPPLYTDERLHDNAQGNDTDPGRAQATGRPGDFNRFRTMSLRDVVERYNQGGDEVEMRPLHLTPDEIDDLVAFLRALRSEEHVVPLR